MNIEISQRPGSAMAKVMLNSGEQITAEGGSMVAMSTNVSLKTTTYKRDQGNIFGALKRVLSGESFFLNHYTAPSEGGEVWLAPTLPGDMLVQELNGEKLIVQSGSYVASSENIDVNFNWQGFKSLLSGESMFWLGISGKGTVVLNAFGLIYPVEVNGEYIVDTSHIVAFQETLNFTISKAGKSWISSFLGGEGFVCKFQGKGTVWCQSHNPKSFGLSIGPSLKPRN
jgi:uncharacterized protein (TIGR00266 family)